MTARLLFALFAILISFSAFNAQTPTPEKEEVIKVDTQLVEVPVIITDKAGRPILNLKQNNFALFEDGKPQ